MFYKKRIFLVVFLVLSILVLSMIVLTSGDYESNIFTLFSKNNLNYNIIVHHRLPIVLTCILTGLALPSAGFVLQELFKNPLAGPSVLGISSAAGLGVALNVFMWIGQDYFYQPSKWSMVVAAFLGAFLAIVIIGFFAYRIKNSESLIIIGLVISGFTSAIVALLEYFAPSEQIKAYLLWSFGKVGGLNFNQIFIYFSCVVIGLTLCFISLKPLKKMLLGREYAATMGVNIKALRILIFLGSSILVAASTAFTGPILFVGLIIPFVCRYVLRTSHFHFLWLIILLSGVATMLLFSILTNIGYGERLPINIIASLVGAPIIIGILWLLKSQKTI